VVQIHASGRFYTPHADPTGSAEKKHQDLSRTWGKPQKHVLLSSIHNMKKEHIAKEKHYS
jgi:hypothetical protein